MKILFRIWLTMFALGFLPAEPSISAVPKSSQVNSKPVIQVWPRAATSLTPMTLGNLIFRAIPSGDRLKWDALQIPGVRWVTDGIDYNRGISSRLGLARVRAGGVRATLLRQRWEELVWSVELSTEENEKWGPTVISIRPGFDTEDLQGQYICFGTGFEGCDFPLAALKDPRLKLTQRCTLGNGANRSIVMRAITTDGRRGTVAYMGSGGSGGYANFVEISALSPEEYCAGNKERGY